jgi:hypothetical protein
MLEGGAGAAGDGARSSFLKEALNAAMEGSQPEVRSIRTFMFEAEFHPQANRPGPRRQGTWPSISAKPTLPTWRVCSKYVVRNTSSPASRVTPFLNLSPPMHKPTPPPVHISKSDEGPNETNKEPRSSQALRRSEPCK